MLATAAESQSTGRCAPPSRRYTEADVTAVLSKLKNFLPSNLKIIAACYEDGAGLGIVISNGKMSRRYEFGLQCIDTMFVGPAPHLSNHYLLQVSDEWATGQFVKSTISPLLPPPPSAQPPAHRLNDEGEFRSWLRSAQPGDQAIYFVGELAQFRHDAPRRIANLQTLADAARPANPRPASESVDITQMQETLGLLSAVDRAVGEGMLHVTQKRALEPSASSRWVYYATRRQR